MDQFVVIDGMRYTQSICTETLSGRPFVVRELFPVFKNEDERELVKKKIEDELYLIFRKYMD